MDLPRLQDEMRFWDDIATALLSAITLCMNSASSVSDEVRNLSEDQEQLVSRLLEEHKDRMWDMAQVCVDRDNINYILNAQRSSDLTPEIVAKAREEIERIMGLTSGAAGINETTRFYTLEELRVVESN